MNRLGEGCSKTLDCLDKGNLKQAELEYRKGYLANVKKLYAEAGSTYPLRFSKAEHWCVWTKKLYVLSRQTEEALKKQNSAQALKLLEQARRHFYQLHEETGTFHCNDVIYEFYTEAAEPQPSEEQLQKIMKQLAEAKPSCIAKEKAELYVKAKSNWQTAVTPLLNDGEIDATEKDSLLKASEAFYRAFGIQYE